MTSKGDGCRPVLVGFCRPDQHQVPPPTVWPNPRHAVRSTAAKAINKMCTVTAGVAVVLASFFGFVDLSATKCQTRDSVDIIRHHYHYRFNVGRTYKHARTHTFRPTYDIIWYFLKRNFDTDPVAFGKSTPLLFILSVSCYYLFMLPNTIRSIDRFYFSSQYCLNSFVNNKCTYSHLLAHFFF